MAFHTVRTNEADPADNFVQETTGNIVASIELSQNAKGRWQPTIKLQFASIDEMREQAPTVLEALVGELKRRFTLADE